MRVFITGATGLIGSHLVPRLLTAGHGVICVTRNPRRAQDLFSDNIEIIGADPCLPGVWQDRARLCDGVINLAGAPVGAGRWTKKRKQAIRRSRLGTTTNLADALAGVEHKVTLISASAVGYYGNTGDHAVGEKAQPGNDFLARLAVEWEHTALSAESDSVRVLPLRIGMVLAAEGGALPRMLPVFRAGFGGPLGSGRQFMPWIHIQDLIEVIVFALNHPDLSGPLNGVVPAPCRQKEFAHALGQVLGKPTFFPVPGLVLRLLMGEMASMVLSGQRVVPNVLKGAGFSFEFPEIDAALDDVLGKIR